MSLGEKVLGLQNDPRVDLAIAAVQAMGEVRLLDCDPELVSILKKIEKVEDGFTFEPSIEATESAQNYLDLWWKEKEA